ncbi:metal-dependent transcriptional regulator [Zunongwangia sp. HRR-M8]|uniref:metal-dependent transcriptional regulator n=1 Tax=Zunongwangia sp. HRR-M8 TaxID=3015170 RepID=UPI0022DDBBCE|nr:metal-dependent transcriptional regulator [Zunongwangia sp. HRR-M8]WBL24011.1 metal-dependent transcriptional regulator [Zunongwangia sp. HRR-M8]
MTLSEENYLKSIYHLQKKYVRGVSTNALAEEMETKASSVTDMVKKLSEKELVNYKKYQGVKLSEKGEHIAIQVIRKHRLWEYFLVEKLQFNWDEVHDIAEQLEHIKSDELIDKLDKFLEFPKRDPHGDPIPDAEGNFVNLEKKILAEFDQGEQGVCVGVKDSSAAFLQYLDRNKIKLGKTISILEKEQFDGSMILQINNKELTISKVAANNIYLKPAKVE